MAGEAGRRGAAGDELRWRRGTEHGGGGKAYGDEGKAWSRGGGHAGARARSRLGRAGLGPRGPAAGAVEREGGVHLRWRRLIGKGGGGG